jgi:hypothetical protein
MRRDLARPAQRFNVGAMRPPLGVVVIDGDAVAAATAADAAR